jgi:AraC-like DNA-binding protein
MKITIKNMVCDRCTLAVKTLLENSDLHYASITLGEVDFAENYGDALPSNALSLLSYNLAELGFSILSDKKSKLIESIKNSCIDYLKHFNISNKITLSQYISDAVKLEYNYLSHLFSVIEGVTIEQHFIKLRVEKVKELLVYDELALGEIAFQLGYSSVPHLSGQFKKITGLTPSYFRTLKNQKLRYSLDKV